MTPVSLPKLLPSLEAVILAAIGNLAVTPNPIEK